MYLPLLSVRLGCIGFGLHLHRRMVGLKIVQLTYDYTSTANSTRKYNLLTLRQLVHRHLNAFEAYLEGRLQLIVLRCTGLAWPFFIYDWFTLIQSSWFTSVYHFNCSYFFSLSSWFSVKTSSTDRLPSSSISLAARLIHFFLDFSVARTMFKSFATVLFLSNVRHSSLRLCSHCTG